MSDRIITPAVDDVISLTEATDEDGEFFLHLTLHLESGKFVRIPIPEEHSLRIWGLLETALKARGHISPTGDVVADKMQ